MVSPPTPGPIQLWFQPLMSALTPSLLGPAAGSVSLSHSNDGERWSTSCPLDFQPFAIDQLSLQLFLVPVLYFHWLSQPRHCACGHSLQALLLLPWAQHALSIIWTNLQSRAPISFLSRHGPDNYSLADWKRHHPRRQGAGQKKQKTKNNVGQESCISSLSLCQMLWQSYKNQKPYKLQQLQAPLRRLHLHFSHGVGKIWGRMVRGRWGRNLALGWGLNTKPKCSSPWHAPRGSITHRSINQSFQSHVALLAWAKLTMADTPTHHPPLYGTASS